MFIERTESLKTNFFPLDCGDFDIQCFAKECNAPNEPRPNEDTYRMVVDKDSPRERQYWISPCCCDGFRQFIVSAHDNPMPDKWIVNAFTCTGAYAVLIMSGLKRVENRYCLHWKTEIGENN